MKNLRTTLLAAIACLAFSSTVEAQTTLEIGNGTSCTGSTTVTNVSVNASSAQFVTIPSRDVVVSVKVSTGGANTTVSYSCSGPTSTTGYEWNGNPVTVNYIATTLLEISD